MDRSDDSTPHDSTVTIPERAQESRFKLWLLLSVNRWVLAGGLAASVFASLVVLGGIGPSSTGKLLEAAVIEPVFESMLVAVITVVSLVLIIGQLTVIQENAPVDDLRERMDGAMAFRQDAEAIADWW